jgi:hypothetical protein
MMWSTLQSFVIIRCSLPVELKIIFVPSTHTVMFCLRSSSVENYICSKYVVFFGTKHTVMFCLRSSSLVRLWTIF